MPPSSFRARPEDQAAPGSLRRNFSWVLVGNVVYSGSQYLLLAVISRLGMPEQLGLYTLAIAFTHPFFSILNLQLRGVLVTDLDYRRRFAAYWATRLVTAATAVALVAISALVMGYDLRSVAVIAVFGVGLGFELLSDFILGVPQHHERMAWVAYSKLAKGAAMLAVFGVSFWSTGDLLLATAARSAVVLLVLATIDLPAARRVSPGLLLSRPDLDAAVVRRVVVTALPLGLFTFLASVNYSVPQLILEKAVDRETLGVFASIAYLKLVGGTIILALSASTTPRLAKLYRADPAGMRRLLLRLVGIGFAIGLTGLAVAVVLGDRVLTLIYGEEFAGRGGILIGVMLGATIAYGTAFLKSAVTATRAFRLHIPLSVITTVICTGLAFVIVPRHGIHGAVTIVVLVALVDLVGYGSALLWKLRRARGTAT